MVGLRQNENVLVATEGATMKNDFDTTAFARRLKQARLDAGLTQMEASARSGVPQSGISAYELGTNTTRLSALGTLVDTYDISEDWLLGRPSR